MSNRHKRLPIAALERIDDLCAEFERSWRTTTPLSIESLLPRVDEAVEREVLLIELVVLEVDYRRRRGETPTQHEYVDRFPEHAAGISDALNEAAPPKTGFQPPTVAQLAEQFPSLEIFELIGAGGMGAVYRARQPGLDRLVALKILPAEFGHDIKFALRFTREARALAKLSHPNIVGVYEFGKVDETYYFLMEYVDGSTLREVVAAGHLDPQHALSIVPHLCDALQYAHDKGVVHRDIKPENILLDRDGAVKIADFGLSRILGNDSQQDMLTGTHQVMGTPRYMAPEQLEGAHGVDHRADIYSLGVVFYEMLTGELPMGHFAAPSRKVKIDVRLDQVVLRSLEKEPSRRYQHASQIKSDVELITSSRDTSDQPTVTMGTPSQVASAPGDIGLAQQELAGRMLLTRRQLMERVERSLRPLSRGQFIQVLLGVALIVLGVQCWARNTEIPHRLISGLILHVYGVLVIAQAMWVVTRIYRIDYTKPVTEIRARLESVRAGYLRAGNLIGFVWWLMWIPVTVAIGFDAVLHPYSLVPSLIIGIVGWGVSLWLIRRVSRSDSPSAETWKRKLAGNSIKSAFLALEEIESAHIR